jgi:Flp pilus assembly pilin Flp
MVKSMALRLWKTARALYRDEQGADMVEYVLIFAAISLPLLAVIIWFWKDISKWAGGLWENVKTDQSGTPPSSL